MEYQDSWNDLFQNAYNTAYEGNATSAQLGTIVDNDIQTDKGFDFFDVGGTQLSTNTLDQFASNFADGGNASSAQVGSIVDNDVQHDQGYDGFHLAAM